MINKKENRFKKFVNKFIYFVGIIGPIMTIPQIIKIWAEKTAAGVSLSTWVAYILIAISWLIYGVINKEKPLIFSNILWIITEIFVILGIIIYG